MSDFRPIEWTIGQGSGFSPIRRGPFTANDVALNLSAATVSVLVIDESEIVRVAWGAVGGAADGDSSGYVEWSVLAAVRNTPGHYRVWWQIDHPDYAEPYLTPEPDVLTVTAIPS